MDTGEFDEEAKHRADMVRWAELDDVHVDRGVRLLGDCLDWEGAVGTGLHLEHGFPVRQSGDNFHNLHNGSSHSSMLAGLLRAGHHIAEIEGIPDNPV